jgi:hypothetical protein
VLERIRVRKSMMFDCSVCWIDEMSWP